MPTNQNLLSPQYQLSVVLCWRGTPIVNQLHTVLQQMQSPAQPICPWTHDSFPASHPLLCCRNFEPRLNHLFCHILWLWPNFSGDSCVDWFLLLFSSEDDRHQRPRMVWFCAQARCVCCACSRTNISRLGYLCTVQDCNCRCLCATRQRHQYQRSAQCIHEDVYDS